jgi:hypothetical protein
MMSKRKPLAALAAITAAVAVAVPTASASAATTERAVSPRQIGSAFGAGSLFCDVLVGEIRFAAATGNIWLENGLGAVLLYSGCGGAAI